MTMEWNGIDGGSSFAEHNKQMQMFRKSHPSDMEVKFSRRDLINAMWPLSVTDPITDTGGEAGLTSTADWSTFAPIGEITKHKFSPN